jgi:chromosomal replication initiator protein
MTDSLASAEHPRIFIRDIIAAAASHYGAKPAEVVSPDRSALLIRPRHVAMFLSRTVAKRSFPEIGRRFNRHHSTVFHAVDKIGAERLVDAKLAADVAAIAAKIGARQ